MPCITPKGNAENRSMFTKKEILTNFMILIFWNNNSVKSKLIKINFDDLRLTLLLFAFPN